MLCLSLFIGELERGILFNVLQIHNLIQFYKLVDSLK